jgi:hypothetical protein
MQKFVIRLLLFLSVIAGAMAGVVGFFSYRLSNPAIYELDESIRFIVVGDSHTQCAIDDALLAGTINVSNGADSYLYSYTKIRKLVESNEHLKGIVLGFSEHNFELAMDDWNFKNENMRNKTAQYFPLLGWEEVVYLGKKNPVSFMTGLIQFPKMKFNVMMRLNSKTSIADIGVGNVERLTQNIKDWKKPTQTKKSNGQSSISQSQVQYLEKIVDLCKAHRLELVLISTPVHTSYPQLNHRSMAITYYAENLTGFKWWNFSDMKLPDSYFADYEHLNRSGASFFTEEIQKKISSEL